MFEERIAAMNQRTEEAMSICQSMVRTHGRCLPMKAERA